MWIIDYHKKDNESVLELPTPLKQFEISHTKEEYRELLSFYQSDEWQQVERDSLNSDRRYYECRKVCSLPDDYGAFSTKKKHFGPAKSELIAERRTCEHFEDLFNDPALRSLIKKLTSKQYEVLILFSKDCTYEKISKLTGNSINNVSKLLNRALNSIRAGYVTEAAAYPDRVPYNLKRIKAYLEKQKTKQNKAVEHKEAA